MHNPRHIPRRTQGLMDSIRTLPPETRDDLNPYNLYLIEQELRDPRSQGRNQQKILLEEQRRLERLQYNDYYDPKYQPIEWYRREKP